jgi:hypothetical protein
MSRRWLDDNFRPAAFPFGHGLRFRIDACSIRAKRANRKDFIIAENEAVNDVCPRLELKREWSPWPLDRE